jgi:protein-S-isoprenylcysteine O-methyltransferase Ste14
MSAIAMNNTVKEDSPDVNLMPPAVFFSCLVFGGVLAFISPIEFPFFSFSVRIIIGLAIGASGFAFMMLAHEKFKKVGTQVPTNQPASELVISGVYRFSRNPMYMGMVSFLFGIGICAGSLWLGAAALPLIGCLAFYVVPREEAYMERAFGSKYLDYCKKVRRWL